MKAKIGTKGIHNIENYNGSRKRPHYLTSWEESFRSFCPRRKQKPADSDVTCKNRFGLVDLFGGNRWVRPCRVSSIRNNDNLGTNNVSGKEGKIQHHYQQQEQKNSTDSFSKFFTLRLEHRQSGTNAKFFEEERFLLFRSDQAGAIAKVVFSSSPVVTNDNSNNNIHNQNQNHHKQQEVDEIKNDHDFRSIRIANATVHLLFVKEIYRGFDLGSFLFVSCMSYLKGLYGNNETALTIPNMLVPGRILTLIRCRLDVEEDIRRHNKLVHFYESLGCSINKRAKIIFINNNDDETYRIIPMNIDLVLSSSERTSLVAKVNSTNLITTLFSSFLPIVFMSASGKRARLNNNNAMDWLIIECDDGYLQLRTTDGRMLRLNIEGQCQLCPLNTRPSTTISQLDKFQLLRVSDMLDKVFSNRKEERYEEEEKRIFMQDKKLQQQLFLSKEKELWMVRSPMDGLFMGLGCKNNIVFSETLSFWQANENFCLTHKSDSPGRRQHHRRMWMKQSVQYVKLMRERYSKFDLHLMTIEEALNLTKYVTTTLSLTPSLRTLSFHTAELAKKEGHPDWVQLVALIHGLAGALTCAGSSSSSSSIVASDESPNGEDFDWTIYVDVRVVGCKAPSDTTLSEFRHLNPDEGDNRYNTRTGLYREHIGLENVLLSWTSNEYMTYMLLHNNVMLPKEAFVLLKLFPLVDWHTKGKYTALSNDADEEMKTFVADFHDICLRAQNNVLSSTGKEMSDSECNDLWKNHYSLVASKYGMADALKW